MNFGKKLKEQRTKHNYTQAELAEKLNVSLRTINNYENYNRYPKQRDVYYRLAEIFSVDVNYFLSENTEFVIAAHEKYGPRSAKQAAELIDEVNGLFAGGQLAEEDIDNMMMAIQKAYWIAKENNRKYTPKKYRNNTI